ncbi:prepilin-type N-terminal cleavage/methylation domain-containing protein [Methylomagnum sp.]
MGAGHQAGFSLLEILVAFALLSLSLGVLLRIFGGAGRIAGTADEYSRAIIVAESLLASAGIEAPLQPGETNGSVDDTYRWTLSVNPYPVDEALAGTQQLGFKPYWVELSVEWGDIDDPRAFDLKTLRLLSDTPGMGGGAVRR